MAAPPHCAPPPLTPGGAGGGAVFPSSLVPRSSVPERPAAPLRSLPSSADVRGAAQPSQASRAVSASFRGRPAAGQANGFPPTPRGRRPPPYCTPQAAPPVPNRPGLHRPAVGTRGRSAFVHLALPAPRPGRRRAPTRATNVGVRADWSPPRAGQHVRNEQRVQFPGQQTREVVGGAPGRGPPRRAAPARGSRGSRAPSSLIKPGHQGGCGPASRRPPTAGRESCNLV